MRELKPPTAHQATSDHACQADNSIPSCWLVQVMVVCGAHLPGGFVEAHAAKASTHRGKRDGFN
jgi:hypothetical protein